MTEGSLPMLTSTRSSSSPARCACASRSSGPGSTPSSSARTVLIVSKSRDASRRRPTWTSDRTNRACRASSNGIPAAICSTRTMTSPSRVLSWAISRASRATEIRVRATAANRAWPAPSQVTSPSSGRTQDLEGHEVLLDGGLPVARSEPPSPFEGGLAVVQVAADARRIEPVAGARPGDELPDAPGSQVGLEEAPHLPDQPVQLVGRAGRFTRRPQEAPQLGDADHAALSEHQRSDQHAGAGVRGRDPSACTLDPDPAEERDVEQGAHRGSSRTTTPSLVVGGRPVDARPW